MRIIAGKYKGRRLRAADGLHVRPTSDRLRETLFNILAPTVADADFLDLCAGSGAVGIEALSRGAARATFVETARRALTPLLENLAHCKIDADAEVVQYDAVGALRRFADAERHFDIIFFDPPYASPIYVAALDVLGERDVLRTDGRLVVEHHAKTPMREIVGRLRRFREVRQGESALSFYAAI
jgi:16S rRNA (guanine(966)-N(2))-methyltransferase RsmD